MGHSDEVLDYAIPSFKYLKWTRICLPEWWCLECFIWGATVRFKQELSTFQFSPSEVPNKIAARNLEAHLSFYSYKNVQNALAIIILGLFLFSVKKSVLDCKMSLASPVSHQLYYAFMLNFTCSILWSLFDLSEAPGLPISILRTMLKAKPRHQWSVFSSRAALTQEVGWGRKYGWCVSGCEGKEPVLWNRVNVQRSALSIQ